MAIIATGADIPATVSATVSASPSRSAADTIRETSPARSAYPVETSGHS
ncbi:hypothetical protein ACWCPS_03265 [Streptomyces mauvecolor]